ncbi:DUF995 domain-containing protein [Pseudooceanicola sp. C21-150M6]|uniref:DUF995 domain-containing protein n=1 Tax=Pseudooceanicola sp. C21-150M6 TaxID=3434355 RepID=UPI003D7F25B1
MNFTKITATACLIAATATSPALSEAKPKGSTKTPPQEIIQLLAGKTATWKNGGTAYYGPSGEYLGTGESKEWVGVGKWYVTTASRMCNETVWTGPKDGKITSVKHEACKDYVTVPDGTVWMMWSGNKGHWYPQSQDAQKVSKGNTQKSLINKLRKKYGV